VERLSFATGPTWQERIFTSPALIEPISFVMSQEMLRNIKRLAEHADTTTRNPTDEEDPMAHNKPRTWSDLTPRQQTTILILGSVQLALAATAWTDLATRPATQVNGRKGVWAAIIAVNFLGPLLYFARGVRRQQ
jgi:hypothetical protein